jgi:hypothetical protein
MTAFSIHGVGPALCGGQLDVGEGVEALGLEDQVPVPLPTYVVPVDFAKPPSDQFAGILAGGTHWASPFTT